MYNWHELFNNLNKITDKLTFSSREKMLSRLTARTDVDFNANNIYAVVIWVIKNANQYYDDQLCSLVNRMVEKANVVMYKSNQRTYRDDDWFYSRRPNDLDRFSLDYRVVLQRAGGLVNSDWQFERTKNNGLTDTAYNLIRDIQTIAINLGFDTSDYEKPMDYMWKSNKKCDFHYHDHRTGKTGVLMTVKAFLNGNLHIKFNASFMCKLNVEFGRLEGWIKNAQQAAEELDISPEEAMQSFDSNLQLSASNLPLLGFDIAA